MKRLMVPPLPAASRPSKRITHALPGLLDPGLQLQQFDLQLVLLLLVVLARHQVLVRVAAFAPVARQRHVRVFLALAFGFLAFEQRVAQGRQIVGRGARDDGLERVDRLAGAAPCPRGARCRAAPHPAHPVFPRWPGAPRGARWRAAPGVAPYRRPASGAHPWWRPRGACAQPPASAGSLRRGGMLVSLAMAVFRRQGTQNGRLSKRCRRRH